VSRILIVKNHSKFVYQGGDMVRDIDSVRDLLCQIEQDPAYDNTTDETPTLEGFGIEGHSEEEMAYDLCLLIREGFINGNADSGYQMPYVRGLTWKGHELLADISDPDIWAKTKEHTKVLAGVGVAFVWEVAKAQIRKNWDFSVYGIPCFRSAAALMPHLLRFRFRCSSCFETTDFPTRNSACLPFEFCGENCGESKDKPISSNMSWNMKTCQFFFILVLRYKPV
jgi:Hypothetical protein (DUF2513)